MNGNLGYCIPASYLCAALLAAIVRRRAWPAAIAASAFALGTALLFVGIAAFGPPQESCPTLLEGTTALLVVLLGWVIVRYSRICLAGEHAQPRFVVSLLFTLAAVSSVVIARNLGVLVGAWIASSLSLQGLLTFYRDRVSARIAAHKQFIASRLSEICMVAAATIICCSTGTLELAGIGAWLRTLPSLPPALHIAAGLVALAVILKSAQLPAHGWLVQVMEAPTPVSALLHAGIVNIGGYVVIRMNELMSASSFAQALLVVAGTATAVIAGLTMMTRTSIKARLAWSTCSQMGFMLMECGLGLYSLAYLHLIAHSAYKAYLFLSSGDTVSETRRRQLGMASSSSSTRPVVWCLLAPMSALALVLGSSWIWGFLRPLQRPNEAIALGIVALGIAPLLVGRPAREWAFGFLAAIGLIQLYLLGHKLCAKVVAPDVAVAANPAVAVWAGCSILVLYLAQIRILTCPRGRFAVTLYPWIYNGFYLDELFTRATFGVLPARLPRHPRQAVAAPFLSPVQA